MLDKQDLVQIEEIVDRKTSDIRHDMSILKQDVGILKQDVGGLKQDVAVLKEDVSDLKTRMTRVEIVDEQNQQTLQLVLENVVETNKKLDIVIGYKVPIDNHEKRISTLELLAKRKLA